MSLNAGTRLGAYEILGAVGAGGMGEVYRARDTRLAREVAIKVLPPLFADDRERLSRFEREAQMLAALNHSNIAAIYGFENLDGRPFLVLEFVPGPTLAERLAAGRLDPAEALRIAAQLAEALEAAHEKGIVHRDLKPANIKITPEGKVKVLDFGLAKAFAEPEQTADPSRSPTMSMLATRAGIILGTAGYMSPEQARGKAVDKRTDVWAFGCVLYEALTGRPAFTGETVSHIIVAVMEREPDWEALPAATPGPVRELLRRSLQKDPTRRLRDIGDARLMLEDTAAGGSTIAAIAPSPGRVASGGPVRFRRLPWSVAALFVLSTLVLSFLHLREKPPAAEVVRFQIPASEKANVGPSVSISPDGRRIAFTASSDGRNLIWIRSLDALEARPLPGTDNAYSFWWSPDSRFIAFDSAGKVKKVEASGGPPQTLCDAPTPVLGGAWSAEGVTIFGSSTTPLMRVAAAGGASTPLTALDTSRGDVFHAWPSFLPDGRHFVYLRVSSQSEYTGIFAGSLDEKPDKKESKPLVLTQVGPRYAPSPDAAGHLLFLREGSLMAQPFDPVRLQVVGEAVPIAERVAACLTNGCFSASANGVLAYRAGGGAQGTVLAWFDREGKTLSVATEPGPYNEVALSPDATRAASTRREGNIDLWLIEFARRSLTRFTFHPAQDTNPVWSPDGSRIAFASSRDGALNLYQKPANGTGNEEPLLQSSEAKFPTDWSRDGRFLLYSSADPKTKHDLWVLPVGSAAPERKPIPFLRTEFNEGQGQFSPDSHWIAYTSDESGKAEVYVQPFPASSGGGGKWMVSSGGGVQPRWRRDGKELFYITPDRKLMAVDVVTNPAFKASTPRALFAAPVFGGVTAATIPFRYDVAPDGKRFLINALGTAESASSPITVVLNWPAAMKR